MTRRTLGSWRDALRGIAVGMFWTQLASGQAANPDAGEAAGSCTPSGGPHECAERCPSFDTCSIDEGDLQLYYRVMGERFECDGLDCTAASTQLGDYCCERGEYAPSRGGGGGGCALTPTGASEPFDRSCAAGACLGALGLLGISRHARGQRRRASAASDAATRTCRGTRRRG